MRVRFVCVVVALAASWLIDGHGVRAQAPTFKPIQLPTSPPRQEMPPQADCPECEKAIENLRAAQKGLAESEARLAAVRKRIQELAESIKAATGFTDQSKTTKAIGELNVEVESAQRRVDEDIASVKRAEFELAECNLACREPKYPEPPKTGEGAAACPKCLEKARSVAHLRHELALLRTIQAGVNAGLKRLDESEQRKLHSDLMSTDKTLAGAEHELEACNESCHTSFFTQPKGIITTSAIVLGGVAIGTAGGGESTVAPIAPPTSTTPPGQVPPSQPPVQPPAQPPPPTQPTEFTVTFTASGWDHVMPGQFSDACGRFVTTPPQANVPFTVTTMGPGVSQETVAGTTNASGVAVFRVRITRIGTYSFNVSATSNGVTRTATGNVVVPETAGTCPSP